MYSKKFMMVSLMVALLLLPVLSACSGNATEGTPASGEKGSSGQAESAGSQQPAKEERVKVSIYLTSYGFKKPDTLDLHDNEYVKLIEEYANVDLDITIPPWEDNAQRQRLMLASGNLPDIVNANITPEILNAEANGAFMDIKTLYDNSAQIQTVITPDMMELIKNQNGNYYRIPMSVVNGPVGGTDIVRQDLLDKYNNGESPASVEQWVDFLRRLKAAEPDSSPIIGYASTDVFAGYQKTMFHMFGVNPYRFRIQNGQVVDEFTLPEFRSVVDLLRQLYDEGIVDKEFATMSGDQYTAKFGLDETAVMFYDFNTDMLLYNIKRRTNPTYANQANWIWQPLDPLKTLPDGVNEKYTYGYSDGLTANIGTYINAKSKVSPERLFRVMEALTSEELQDKYIWGTEGVHYKIENGDRVPDFEKMSDPEHTWAGQFAVIFGFVNDWVTRLAYAKSVYPEEAYTMLEDRIELSKEQAQIRGVSFLKVLDRTPDIEELDKMEADRRLAQTEAIVKAVMGQISMEQFDQLVNTYKSKYTEFTKEYTRQLQANKDQWLAMGVNEAAW